MTQLLAGAGPYLLTKTWYVDGTPTNVGTVTIGITDGNGDSVVAGGTATTNVGSGVYTYQLADQANPDLLKITWTRSDTSADLADRIELIGAWLFTEAQARTFGAKADATSSLIPLASSTEYTDAMLADGHERIVADFEAWTGRSWIPRYCRLELPGSWSSTLSLSRGRARTSDGFNLHRPGHLNDIAQVLSVTVSGESVSVGSVQVDPLRECLIHDTGTFAGSSTQDPFNVVVEYVYGLPYPTDGADQIALRLLVDRLVPSPYPSLALRWDLADGSSMSLVQPGGPMRNVSRVPEVNQWVNAHNYRVLVG